MPKVPVIVKPKPLTPERTVVCVRNGKTVKLSGDEALGEQIERLMGSLIKRRNERNRAK